MLHIDMNDKLFWELIGKAYESPGGEVYSALIAGLERLPMGDLLDYNDLFLQYRLSVVNPTHLSAAFLLHAGRLSYDDWLTYLESVVAIPYDIFLIVRKSPDYILDYADLFKDLLDYDTYPFATAAIAVGVRRFGQKWRDAIMAKKFAPITMDGISQLNKIMCKDLTPRLYEKYGEQCDW